MTDDRDPLSRATDEDAGRAYSAHGRRLGPSTRPDPVRRALRALGAGTGQALALAAHDFAVLGRDLWHQLVKPQRCPRDARDLAPGVLPPSPYREPPR